MNNTITNDKKVMVKLTLVGLDGNAFALLGAFKGAARKAGYKFHDIDPIIKDATSGDYDHLLAVLSDHCVDDDSDSDY